MTITTTYDIRSGAVFVVTSGASDGVFGADSFGVSLYATDTAGGVEFGQIGANGQPTVLGTAPGDDPSVTRLTNARFVVTSQVAGETVITLFDDSNAVLTTVNTGSLTNAHVSIQAQATGGFVVCYDKDYGGGDFDVRLQFYDSTGALLATAVPDLSSAMDRDPSFAVLANGNVAVAWTRTAGATTDLMYAVYDSSGGVVRAPVAYSTVANLNQNPSLVATPTGFAIAYNVGATVEDASLYISTFSPTGLIEGTAQTPTEGSYQSTDPTLVALSNGLLVVTDTIQGFARTRLLDQYGTVVHDQLNYGTGNNASIDYLGDSRLGFLNSTASSVQVGVLDMYRVIVGDGADDIYTAPDFLNHDMDGGAGNDVLLGNNGRDILKGGIGADTLGGAAGNDTISGGDGDDILAGGYDADVLHGDGGNDFLYSAYQDSPDSSGVGDQLFGDAGDDTLRGSGGTDTLNGGTGIDFMQGGDGDDTYIVDHLGDSTIEQLVEGIDNVISSVSWTLAANVENLTLMGAGVNGTGNDLNNIIVGNASNNVLNGLGGADRMQGLGGADNYFVDDIGDVVIEANVTGVDRVNAAITYTLGVYVENLTLTGAANINGSGNAVANVIVGNIGDNVINGLVGADTMQGLAGSDIYYVDNSGDTVIEVNVAGIDKVNAAITYTLGAYVENLSLTGTASINGTGNTLANVIVGNAGDNILNGLTGADKMQGAAGSDTYYVDNIGDVVVEQNIAGTDKVFSTINWTLSAYVEDLTLTGTGNLNGTGNTLANLIVGTVGNNVIDGLAGADKMQGLAGSDTYYVDNVGDVIVEQNVAGTDVVNSSITWTLGSYIENLNLTGASAIDGTGNALANALTGNAAANVLNGGGGDDRLFGGAGADTLTGGTGVDTFVYTTPSQSSVATFDRITDLTSADRIDLSAIDANTGAGGDQAFAIVNAFSNVAGQMTLDYAAGPNLTTILMDINGDGVADMKITVTGNQEAYTNFVF